MKKLRAPARLFLSSVHITQSNVTLQTLLWKKYLPPYLIPHFFAYLHQLHANVGKKGKG